MKFQELVSLPSDPPPPDRRAYGPAQLARFQLYDTRDAFRREHGVEPPAFRTDIPVKHWWTSEPVTGIFRYLHVVEKSGAGRIFEDKTITAELARTINIPGVFRFPDYEIEPTQAVVRIIGSGVERPVQPRMLAHPDWVMTLRAELAQALGLRGSDIRIRDASNERGNGFTINVYPDDEHRRITEIRHPKTESWHNAGELWMERNENGVGRAGRWSNNWTWAPQGDEPGEMVTGQGVCPVPLRALLATEFTKDTPFGLVISEQPFGEAGGGGEEAAWAIDEILALVRIAQKDIDDIRAVLRALFPGL